MVPSRRGAGRRERSRNDLRARYSPDGQHAVFPDKGCSSLRLMRTQTMREVEVKEIDVVNTMDCDPISTGTPSAANRHESMAVVSRATKGSAALAGSGRCPPALGRP